jgi:hypothetical protein
LIEMPRTTEASYINARSTHTHSILLQFLVHLESTKTVCNRPVFHVSSSEGPLVFKKPIIMALDEQTCSANQVTASYHWLQVWRMGMHRAQSRLSLVNVAFETQPTPLCQVLQTSRQPNMYYLPLEHSTFPQPLALFHRRITLLITKRKSNF